MPLNTFFKLSAKERWLFFEACATLFYVFFLVLVPIKYYATLLGEKDCETSENLSEKDLVTTSQVKHAIRRAAKYTFWDTRCLIQSVTGKIMLRKRGLPSTMYMGVAKEDSSTMKAHSWLRCGNVIVTGKKGMQKYTVVSSFGKRVC